MATSDLPTEPSIHSFIVKIFVENAPGDRSARRLHGYVTHVPGGERCYLTSLRQIPGIIAPYVGGYPTPLDLVLGEVRRRIAGRRQ